MTLFKSCIHKKRIRQAGLKDLHGLGHSKKAVLI